MAPNVTAVEELAPHLKGVSDPIVTQIAAEDKVKWYKKPNLRVMYLCLFACCMGIEMTSGFDSQLINTLQYSNTWYQCSIPSYLSQATQLNYSQISATPMTQSKSPRLWPLECWDLWTLATSLVRLLAFRLHLTSIIDGVDAGLLWVAPWLWLSVH